jgi:drug/metabolite transporter (DMT)-like permease
VIPGIACALAAGLMWGLVFIAPLLLPEYTPAALSLGRYLAFGVVALPLAWLDRARLRQLTRADWFEALKLAFVGNLLYYFFLAAAIQASGAPLATMIIGTLPVVIAVCANWSDRTLPWRAMAPSLLLIAAGLALVNRDEFRQLAQGSGRSYLIGSLLALVAVAAWTWYPIRNSRWMQANPGLASSTWATAQGIATLPLAAAGWLVYVAWQTAWNGLDVAGIALGPRPWAYLGLMLAIAVFASWLGTLAWNRASRLLPTSLAGQLIVFETLAALVYAFLLRGRVPETSTLAGIAMLIGGVVFGVRAFQKIPAKAVPGLQLPA